MTKQEFIQEAALRLLSSQLAYTMKEVTDNSRALADEIYGKDEEQEPEILTAIPADEPITNLFFEIDRLDWEERMCRVDEYKVKYPKWKFRPQKSGYAERVRKICSVLGIKQVINLIDFGRSKFRRQQNIGEKTIEIVNEALMNLYNVKSW